ncbi:MAG TPA: tetratricopeptide repeat protein [Candidatus Limnocylindria bacterium]|nr:tetratricopeptide repeat protein [Candidatus Limnocylindria bacterium]
MAVAYAAFGLTFRGPRARFWDRMTTTGLALGGLALSADRDARRARIGPREVALGLAIAAGLYGIFRAGDSVARRVMPRGGEEIGDIYALRSLRPKGELAARLAFVIGPAEELFWRGFVQRRAGFVATTALYGGAHVVTENATLTGAATVAGAYWGLLRALGAPLGALVASHVAWDIWIFLLAPTEPTAAMSGSIDELWDYDDPEASERRFAARLATVDPAEDQIRFELRTQIARAQGLQRRFAEAHATLDEVERSGPRSGRVRARYALERGRVLNSSGDPSASKPHFEEALEIAWSAGEAGLAVDAAHMIAIAVPEPDAKLEWGRRALEMARGSADPRAQRWVGSLLNNIGWTHFDAGRYAEAMRAFEEELRWLEPRGEEKKLAIARYSVGRVLRAQGRLAEALALQRELHNAIAASGGEDPFVVEEVAENLHALGRREEARPFFARAHAGLSKDRWLSANEPRRIARLAELAAAD